MVERPVLLKQQRNEVFNTLQEKGLEPADFSWDSARLNYLDGRYFFQFDIDNRLCFFSPGYKKPVQYISIESWNRQIFCMKAWIMYLEKEMATPDLWAEVEEYKSILSLAPGEQLANKPIPQNEVEKIEAKLQLLAEKIEQQFELDEEQKQFVRSKLNYLADAAKRQPLRDWQNIAASVFLSIALNLVLEPEKAQQLKQLIKSIIEPFLRLLGS